MIRSKRRKYVRASVEFWWAPDDTDDICIKIADVVPLMRIKRDPTKAAGHAGLWKRLAVKLVDQAGQDAAI